MAASASVVGAPFVDYFDTLFRYVECTSKVYGERRGSVVARPFHDSSFQESLEGVETFLLNYIHLIIERCDRSQVVRVSKERTKTQEAYKNTYLAVIDLISTKEHASWENLRIVMDSATALRSHHDKSLDNVEGIPKQLATVYHEAVLVKPKFDAFIRDVATAIGARPIFARLKRPFRVPHRD